MIVDIEMIKRINVELSEDEESTLVIATNILNKIVQAMKENECKEVLCQTEWDDNLITIDEIEHTNYILLNLSDIAELC